MFSRYSIFCMVIETGSFTKTAEVLGYSQSSISQHIKSLEQELGTNLINRKKNRICPTKDGAEYLPYFKAIFNAERDLKRKKQEMKGLKNNTIKIGTFTSVSRNILPMLMKNFKELYPEINFVLKQGEYTSIQQWIKDDKIDFGFINGDVNSDLEMAILYRDKMLAVLPKHHPLAKNETISLQQLAKEPFILLDEGDFSVIMNAFKQQNLSPDIEYEVYDDYSILAMVRQNLGISAMYQLVLQGFENNLEIRPIKENPQRTIALVWREWDTMSLASRSFINFILEQKNECQKISTHKI